MQLFYKLLHLSDTGVKSRLVRVVILRKPGLTGRLPREASPALPCHTKVGVRLCPQKLLVQSGGASPYAKPPKIGDHKT